MAGGIGSRTDEVADIRRPSKCLIIWRRRRTTARRQCRCPTKQGRGSHVSDGRFGCSKRMGRIYRGEQERARRLCCSRPARRRIRHHRGKATSVALAGLAKNSSILWGALVGEPSCRKSPPIDPLRDAIQAIEIQANADWTERQSDMRRRRRSQRHIRTTGRQDVRAAVKAERAEHPRPPGGHRSRCANEASALDC